MPAISATMIPVENVLEKDTCDPVLTAQVANGFALQGLIPDYFPDDSDSRGYATSLEWRNLDYHAIAAVQYQMRAIKGFDEFATQC